MNLILINPSLDKRPEIFGLGRAISRDFNIYILTPDKVDKPHYDVYEGIDLIRVPCFIMKMGQSVLVWSSTKILVNILKNLIRKKDYCLLHTCDYEYPTSFIPPLFKKMANKVLISIVNDALIGHSYFFGNILNDWTSRCYTYSIGRMVLRYYDKVIFLYPELSKQAMSLGLRSTQVSTIPFGIDLREIEEIKRSLPERSSLREQLKIKENERIILYVGRLTNVKRPDLLIMLLASLKKSGYDNVRLIIVGTGPLIGYLKRLAHLLKVHREIKFTGYVTEEKKWQIFSISDIFVLPSISEGLPRVLLEASAFGLAIVTNGINGMPYLLRNTQNGFLVYGNRFESYVNYVSYLIDDEDLLLSMKKKGIRNIKKFDWSIIAKKYLNMFTELVNQRR